MLRPYVAHWILGLTLAIIWFWGPHLLVPPDAVALAKTGCGVILGHALANYKNS